MAEEEKTGVFEIEPGNTSYMRVASFCCVLNSIVVSWFIILKGDESGNGLYLAALFLLAGLVPKALQSFAENRWKR